MPDFQPFRRLPALGGIDDERIIRVALGVEGNADRRDRRCAVCLPALEDCERTDRHHVFLDEVQYAISREQLKNPDAPPRPYGVPFTISILTGVRFSFTEWRANSHLLHIPSLRS